MDSVISCIVSPISLLKFQTIEIYILRYVKLTNYVKQVTRTYLIHFFTLS